MSVVEKKLRISAPIERVWDALTNPTSIAAWMDDESVMVDLVVGGKYAVFGGQTTGAFTRIDGPRHLEYTWRQAEWRKTWKDSVVTWTLRRDGDGTRVTLLHSQFPNDEERSGHDEGWDIYWLNPMRDWLESSQPE
ncbi:MAG: SRPBCC domain-containing protein [Chloroflexi bacterium]|nr:SRPBCC domain-containing protein [Chloroflexota bacterium]MCL5275917.1 SRPBCC domain-containing protein [Chloroflexota bacterium]